MFTALKKIWQRIYPPPRTMALTNLPSCSIAPVDGQRYRHATPVVSEALGDGLILVHLDQGLTFRLNHTGKAVWEESGRGLTIEEIVAHLEGRWQVPAAKLRSDVSLMLGQLLGHQLLEPRPHGEHQ